MGTVKHYLYVYTTRKEMQENGTTNPEERYKTFTCDFVQKLQNMRPDDEIVLKDSSFFDSKGNLIIELPE